jgi:prophage regulatory protein
LSDRFLSWPQLAAIVPFSRQHIGRLEREGRFPQRRQVGSNRVAWLASEVEEWLRARPIAPRGHYQIGGFDRRGGAEASK